MRWCALTPDGHFQSGAYVFSYAGPTRLSTRSPATADASADCRSAAARDGAALLGWPIVGLLVAFVLFLVTAALLNRRRGQPVTLDEQHGHLPGRELQGKRQTDRTCAADDD